MSPFRHIRHWNWMLQISGPRFVMCNLRQQLQLQAKQPRLPRDIHGVCHPMAGRMLGLGPQLLGGSVRSPGDWDLRVAVFGRPIPHMVVIPSIRTCLFISHYQLLNHHCWLSWLEFIIVSQHRPASKATTSINKSISTITISIIKHH